MKPKINNGPLRVKITKVQARVASWLNIRFNKCSVSKKKIAVILFCFCFGALSLEGIVEACLLKRMDRRSLTVQRLHIPPVVRPLHSATVSADGYRDLKHFGAWLESLSKTDTAAYHLIMTSRPHLLDSINQLESIYLGTNK